MRRWIRLGLDVVLPRACPTCDRPLPAGAPSRSAPRVGLRSSSRSRVRARAAAVPHRPAAPACRACSAAPPSPAHARSGRIVPATRATSWRARCSSSSTTAAGSSPAPLAELLAEHYPYGDDALLVPVPLHLSRLRARGYNQALLLARALARRRRLACDSRLLVRTRATPEQAELDADARRTNVRGAFALRARREALAPERGRDRRRADHRRHGRRVRARPDRRRRPAGAPVHRRPDTVTALVGARPDG